MDQGTLEDGLADLHLSALRFFTTLDSTNDEAWRWLDSGAPHGALVIADEQTAGRGRLNRRWTTIAGSGLAFSLILLSPQIEPATISRLSGLGALAVARALSTRYSLPAQIKWPNDILLNQHKAGGVLVEASWHGQELKAAIIGIGINIAPDSVKPLNTSIDGLTIPATCVEEALGHSVDRTQLLHAILYEFFSWLPKLSSTNFIQAWKDSLAYRDQWVELWLGNDTQSSHQKTISSKTILGKVLGLTSDGSLQLRTSSGKIITAQVGEIRLRPIDAVPPG